MKDKILFWIDDFIHFGIAKYIQEKYDCELFAVIDVLNKSRKFFQEQQIVKFQKVWYYNQHLPTEDEKPDMAYLNSFESRNKINLWNIVYLDRMFSYPTEYYKPRTDEILSLVQRACKLSETILDEVKPNFYCTKPTNMHHNRLFFEICKSKDIKILMLNGARFGYRYAISKDLNEIDNFRNIENTNNIDDYVSANPSEIQDYIKKYSAQNQGRQAASKFQVYRLNTILSWFLRFFFARNNGDFGNSFNRYGQTRLRILGHAVIHVLQKKHRENFINNNFANKLNQDNPFVYFPLHVEPELSTLVGAPFYTNQIEVIRNISKSLPIGYKLYVKEHPGMILRNWRPISYYRQIMDLPNVILVHPSIKSEEILKKCSLVITITGTSGFEAAFYQKPSIVLSDVNYSMLPCVYRLQKIEELPEAIRRSLQTQVNLLDLQRFINMMEQVSFKLDLVELYVDINNRFYHGGTVENVDISESEMRSFLADNNLVFDQLALEHIKKIQQYKKVTL